MRLRALSFTDIARDLSLYTLLVRTSMRAFVSAGWFSSSPWLSCWPTPCGMFKVALREGCGGCVWQQATAAHLQFLHHVSWMLCVPFKLCKHSIRASYAITAFMSGRAATATRFSRIDLTASASCQMGAILLSQQSCLRSQTGRESSALPTQACRGTLPVGSGQSPSCCESGG